MKKLLLAIVFLCFFGGAFAQNTSGTIRFERKTYWIEIMSKLPWITQQDVDRDRVSWGKNQGRPQPYMLYFTKDMSLYQRLDEESEYTYSWRKDLYILIRNYNTKKSEDIVETFGKKYSIEDDIPKYKWKILNEIKEVAGYLCMKAETYDPVKDQTIVAWFSDAIPSQAGPEGFGGLPGMILEININNGCLIVVATDVNIDDTEIVVPLPDRKTKKRAKKINRVDFNAKMKKFIDDSIEGRKNPYWTVRY